MSKKSVMTLSAADEGDPLRRGAAGCSTSRVMLGGEISRRRSGAGGVGRMLLGRGGARLRTSERLELLSLERSP